MKNLCSLTLIPLLPSCGKEVFYLPDTNLPRSPLLDKMDAVLNGFGNVVAGALYLTLAVGAAWLLYRIVRAIFRNIGQVLIRTEQWHLNVDESLAALNTQQSSASRDIRWLERANQKHEEKIAIIEKLLVDLKAHSGFEIKEMADNVAKEFTGEVQP